MQPSGELWCRNLHCVLKAQGFAGQNRHYLHSKMRSMTLQEVNQPYRAYNLEILFSSYKCWNLFLKRINTDLGGLECIHNKNGNV